MDRFPDNNKTASKEKPAHTLIGKAFHLSLSDGTSWCLRGDYHTFQWVSRLAAIMELGECAVNGSHELVFCRAVNLHVVSNRMNDEITSKFCSYGSRIYSYFYHHRTLGRWCHDSIPGATCEVLFNNGAKIDFLNMWFALHPIYQQSICKGGLPFHAGLAERDGRGVLLAASGDTGKSTCCRRLPDAWQPLCDDEALIVLDNNENYRAHPFPTWSDYIWRESKKTWNVQYSVPLSIIFFLEQSEIDTLTPIGEGETVLLISESAMQICEKFWENASEREQRKFRKMLFNNACKMAKQIKAYRLGVSRNGRFWDKMEEVL